MNSKEIEFQLGPLGKVLINETQPAVPWEKNIISQRIDIVNCVTNTVHLEMAVSPEVSPRTLRCRCLSASSHLVRSRKNYVTCRLQSRCVGLASRNCAKVYPYSHTNHSPPFHLQTYLSTKFERQEGPSCRTFRLPQTHHISPFSHVSLWHTVTMSTVHPIESEEAFTTHKSSLPPHALLIIFFRTDWAKPCEQLSTILSTLASDHPVTTPPTISFVSLDAEALPEISESYDVSAVPFLVLERDSKTLETVSGSDATKVRSAIERHTSAKETKKASIPPPLDAIPRKEEDYETKNGAAPPPEATKKDLSKYAPTNGDPKTAPDMSSSADKDAELNQRLEGLVKAAPVMLFMKGTPSSPQCGFSRTLVGILRERGVRYGFFNILADEDVRQGLKRWAEWPTFPQLWVGGELVGGLDIVSVWFLSAAAP